MPACCDMQLTGRYEASGVQPAGDLPGHLLPQDASSYKQQA